MTSPSVSEARDINRTELSNGLRVITEPMPHLRSVSLGVWVGTGSRNETPAQNGISHFIEHMVFKGTKNRTAEQIAKAIDATGGNLDAWTSKEMVSYNTKVIDDHLPVAFDILSDMVLHPLFRPADIEKEKGVILEELKMEVDSPEYLVHETFFSNFWKRHPLGRSILGTKSTVKSFEQSLLFDYYRSVYTPRNMVITAAGRIEHERVLELADRYFGGLEARTTTVLEGAPDPQTPFILKSKKSLEQVHLCVGVPSLPIADPRRYVCYVLSTLLGGGMSSRLFQNIREKHGLCYSVFSELNLYRDTGCLAVYAGTAPDNARRVVTMIVDELRRIYSEPLPEEDLLHAKDHLKGSLALSLESTGSRMSNLARQELFFGRFFGIDEMVACVEAVTADDVQQLAREFFAGRQAGVTVLGRVEGLDLEPSELVC
jgi:predicted Zn-dependent peptidase